MVFDYGKLRGRIREKFKTQAAFAKALGLSNTSLSTKLNNGSEFNQKEICKCVALLEIQCAEIPDYFFTQNVQLSELKAG